MDFLVTNQWELFIGLEVLSFLLVIIFFIVRYAFIKPKLSLWFLSIFFICFGIEILLALLIYRETGEISRFTVVITIFLLYAVTFGISDFQKLDRYMKKKVGKWRGVNLLTDKDIERIERAKDPKYISRNSAIWWVSHTAIFMIVHIFFWLSYGQHTEGILYYITDWSWFSSENDKTSPFNHEIISSASKLWIIVYAVDTIISWSYILFPGEEK